MADQRAQRGERMKEDDLVRDLRRVFHSHGVWNWAVAYLGDEYRDRFRMTWAEGEAEKKGELVAAIQDAAEAVAASRPTRRRKRP